MCRECRSAQHDEVADRTGDDGDHGACLERVNHEFVVEEQGHVTEGIPAGVRGRHRDQLIHGGD
jgi:hypothetical protein